MNAFKSILGDAAGGALCTLLSAYGRAAPLLRAISMIEPTPFGEVVATTAGMAGLAAYFGCTWDPFAQGPEDDTGLPTGCKKTDGEIQILRTRDGAPAGAVIAGIREILSTRSVFNKIGPDGNAIYEIHIRVTDIFGDTGDLLYTTVPAREVDVATVVSGSCLENLPTPPPPDPPTYTHTDPASGCELNVNFKGWGVNTADNINGVWEISPALPSTRASGGVIGGCNFSPVIYIDDGGGGDGGGRYFTIPDPVPPDGEEPWWAPLVRGAAQGLAAKAVEELINGFLETKYGGGSYELKGVCELDPDGNPMDVTRSTNFPEATSPDAILFRLDALADMFQFAKELRQPICRDKGQPITGDPVTLNFISDDVSPESLRQLRKRFVYFDQVNSTLEATVNHWRDFTWQAGPVIVNCMGTKLGKPQVWAASLDEAKRVFAHAAAIAGVDLTGAEYPVSAPKNPRYGVTGLMRIHKDNGGTLGITKRDGPSGFPEGLG